MNIYLAVAGALSIGLALTHALWGERNLAQKLLDSELEKMTSLGFYISYHQITSVLILNGLGLMNAAMSTDPMVTFMLSAFILAIIIGNFGVFLLVTLKKHRELLKLTFPQIVRFGVKIVLIVLGIVLR